MRIKLITPEIHAELTAIAEEHPELIFNNTGYQYLSLEVRESKAEQIDRISEILKEHVVGFAEFFNFQKKDEELKLRFDYSWDRYFTGVGYLLLDHLRDGFPAGASQA